MRDIWHAACIGAADEVARILDADPSLIDARGGWFDWEPLLYAAYSRLDLPGRSTLAAARLLVERGANPNVCYMWGGDCRFTALTGAFGEGEQGPVNQPPHPEWEEFARLLLDAGADPNDGQALYNRMFSRDDRCVEMLLESPVRSCSSSTVRGGRGWSGGVGRRPGDTACGGSYACATMTVGPMPRRAPLPTQLKSAVRGLNPRAL